jgi:hypothetical protein
MQGMKYGLLSIALIVFSSVPCEAEIFKWIDEEGKVHFTDSPKNIPKNSKVETRNELSITTSKKRQASRAEIRSPDSKGQSQKIEVNKKRLNVTKFSNRQKDILDKMETDINNMRERLMKSEAQYLALKNESIRTSQEALNDIDYSDQHREERHELQRKAYGLDQKHVEARAAYFDIKQKLKYKEYQLEEFLRSLDE